MAHYPSNAPGLDGADDEISSLPAHDTLHGGALAVPIAEFAVVLLRGSAAAVLLSPALLVAVLLAG